ncbi:MAG: LamG-like jellyroll fold domain-containing protein [Verrucomicrobiota bacterium]
MPLLVAEAATNFAGITVPGSTSYAGTGNHKPAPGSPINWSRPLATGLVTALAVNEGSGTNFFDAVWQTNWFPQVLDLTAPGALPPAWVSPPVSADYPWGGPAINNLGGGSNALQIMGSFISNLVVTNTTGFTYGALVQPLDTTTFGRITDSPAAVMCWYLNTPGRNGLLTTTWFGPTGTAINPTYPFTVNKWILVLFTVQPNLGVIYVNGIPVTTNTTVSLNYIGQSHPVAYNGTIGPGGHGGAYMCNANFGSWWIWNNRVLTASEVAQMYTNPWSMFYSGAEKGFIKGTKLDLHETAVVSNVCFYSHAAAGNVRLGIYDNRSPKHLLWQSATIPNPATSNWITAPISTGVPGTLTLSTGACWLVWQTDSAMDVPSYTPGTNGDGFMVNQAFGPFSPTLTGETATSETWSMYLTYLTPRQAPVFDGYGWQGKASFQVQGVTGSQQPLNFFTSTNLTNWLLLDTGTAGSNGRFQFLDTNTTGFPQRFYRGVLQ